MRYSISQLKVSRKDVFFEQISLLNFMRSSFLYINITLFTLFQNLCNLQDAILILLFVKIYKRCQSSRIVVAMNLIIAFTSLKTR